jgi:hypothetical protein
VITLDRSAAVRTILVGRFALGAVALILPRFTTRLLQMDPNANPASSFLMRLFGVRDIFLGVAPLLVAEPGRGRILGAAAGVDLTDATAAVLAGLTRRVPPRASAIATAAALAGACLSAATVGRGPLGRVETDAPRLYPPTTGPATPRDERNGRSRMDWRVGSLIPPVSGR